MFLVPPFRIFKTTDPGGSCLGKRIVCYALRAKQLLYFLNATVAAPTSIPHAFPSRFIDSTYTTVTSVCFATSSTSCVIRKSASSATYSSFTRRACNALSVCFFSDNRIHCLFYFFIRHIPSSKATGSQAHFDIVSP